MFVQWQNMKMMEQLRLMKQQLSNLHWTLVKKVLLIYCSLCSGLKKNSNVMKKKKTYFVLLMKSLMRIVLMKSLMWIVLGFPEIQDIAQRAAVQTLQGV